MITSIKNKLSVLSLKLRLFLVLGLVGFLNRNFPNNIKDLNSQNLILIEENINPINFNFRLMSALTLDLSLLDYKNPKVLVYLKTALETILTALSSTEFLAYNQLVNKGEKRFKPNPTEIIVTKLPEDTEFDQKIKEFVTS